MNAGFFVIIVAVWLYLLYVFKRANLKAWGFLWGSLGLFAIIMVFISPIVTDPLAKCVSAIAGVAGELTGTFSAYFKYGILFITSKTGETMTLLVDMECSGVIEISAFLCLLMFYSVYTVSERVIISVAGFIYIMLCNAIRITVICLAVYFGGSGAYYLFHTFIGRIIFYVMSVLMYFYIFTKPQVIQMKVGNFKYGHDKENS